jgi:PAS domain-containing protein
MVDPEDQCQLALVESEKRLSQIIQGLSIAAFVLDARHVLTYCNKAFEAMVGIPMEGLIGTQDHWKAFYPTPSSTLADLIINNASEEDIARRYPGKYKKSTLIKDAYEVEDFFPNLLGGGKWIFFTAAPLLDEEGKVIGAIETLQDISDRKKRIRPYGDRKDG